MTKICFLMVGVSGSGKSSLCDKVLETSGAKNPRVFSLDDCRHLLFSNVHDRQGTYAEAFAFANEKQEMFNRLVTERWNWALRGDAVVVDNTNLTRKSRSRWIQSAKAKGFTVCAIQVMTPLQVVIDRQLTRGDKRVPENVVRDMYMRQQEILLGEEADFLLIADGTADAQRLEGSLHFA